jgi:hypothetical protein
MLLFYLAVELVVGTWGLFLLGRERSTAEAHPKNGDTSLGAFHSPKSCAIIAVRQGEYTSSPEKAPPMAFSLGTLPLNFGSVFSASSLLVGQRASSG